MSTDEQPTPTPDDAERREWFTLFGYRGDLTEVVTLRGDLGTATVAEVWQALQGLRNLEVQFPATFTRTATWAIGDRRPLDPANRLSDREYGPLTDGNGDWLPGVRIIVAALLMFREDDDIFAEFTDQPLVPASEVPAAA